jgi:hypothetical protein
MLSGAAKSLTHFEAVRSIKVAKRGVEASTAKHLDLVFQKGVPIAAASE